MEKESTLGNCVKMVIVTVYVCVSQLSCVGWYRCCCSSWIWSTMCGECLPCYGDLQLRSDSSVMSVSQSVNCTVLVITVVKLLYTSLKLHPSVVSFFSSLFLSPPFQWCNRTTGGSWTYWYSEALHHEPCHIDVSLNARPKGLTAVLHSII